MNPLNMAKMSAKASNALNSIGGEDKKKEEEPTITGWFSGTRKRWAEDAVMKEKRKEREKEFQQRKADRDLRKSTLSQQWQSNRGGLGKSTSTETTASNPIMSWFKGNNK